MATSLLDYLKSFITPELVGLTASRLGEGESATSRGLNAALPMILSAVLQKSNDSGAMAQIMSVLTSRANHSAMLDDPRALLAGDPSASPLTDLGGTLLSTLFGRRLGSATNALGEYAGLKSTSASSVMTLAASLVTASLGEKVRRDGLTASGLAGLLGGQRDGILAALPGMLAGLGGLGGGLRDRAATTLVREGERRTSGLGWLPWAAAAALVLLAGAWALTRTGRVPEVQSPGVADAARRADQMAREAGDSAARQAAQAGQAAKPMAREAGDNVAQQAGHAAQQGQMAIAGLGAFTTRRLPTNVELSVPERGVESQLIAYLDDPSKQLEPVVWFNFDRLLFETGSATLEPESREQLKNVAEIMKAYPTVKLKIGGYTDNVGDPAANLALSQNRASNVMAEIVTLGVAPGRLSAEGFGEQFPVANNATDAGKQLNRRIALRVTEK